MNQEKRKKTESRPSVAQTDPTARLTLRVRDELFGDDAARRVSVRLWEGTLWPDDAPRLATVVLKHPGALRQMFLPGTELGLAEAYLYDDFDIEGQIEAVFDLAETLSRKGPDLIQKLGLAYERMLFYIDGYGGFWLTFAEPWSGMDKQGGSPPMNTLSDTQEERS